MSHRRTDKGTQYINVLVKKSTYDFLAKEKGAKSFGLCLDEIVVELRAARKMLCSATKPLPSIDSDTVN
jgi:hypothetical protein